MTASESTLRFPEWPLKYREALLEADREKLSERVAEAEAAIFDRRYRHSSPSRSLEYRLCFCSSDCVKERSCRSWRRHSTQ